MLDMGSPLLDLALVALHPSSQQQQQQQQGSDAAATASSAPGSLGIDVTGGSGGDAGSGDGGGTPPRECVLLRWGGLMSVLDLERGSEMALSADVSVGKV